MGVRFFSKNEGGVRKIAKDGEGSKYNILGENKTIPIMLETLSPFWPPAAPKNKGNILFI